MQNYVNTRLARQIKGRQIDFVYLSDHPDLTLEVIKAYPDAHWDWESIQNHDNMCIEWLGLEQAHWDWAMLPDIEVWSFDWVRRLPEKPWQWSVLHYHPEFDLSWVAEFPDKPWNMHEISARPTMKDLLKYPGIHWVWDVVTYASPVTTQEMAMHSDLPWDFSDFAFDTISEDDVPFLMTFRHLFDESIWTDFTSNAEWGVIRRYPDLPWDWYQIEPDGFVEEDMELIRRRDPSEINWKTLSMLVPFSIIMANADLPWRSEWVSMNDTLTFNDLTGPFNWDYSFVPCEPVPDLIRKWTAANTIKRQFRESIANPSYLMCRRRLNREAEELSKLQ